MDHAGGGILIRWGFAMGKGRSLKGEAIRGCVVMVLEKVLDTLVALWPIWQKHDAGITTLLVLGECREVAGGEWLVVGGPSMARTILERPLKGGGSWMLPSYARTWYKS